LTIYKKEAYIVSCLSPASSKTSLKPNPHNKGYWQ